MSLKSYLKHQKFWLSCVETLENWLQFRTDLNSARWGIYRFFSKLFIIYIFYIHIPKCRNEERKAERCETTLSAAKFDEGRLEGSRNAPQARVIQPVLGDYSNVEEASQFRAPGQHGVTLQVCALLPSM